MSQSGRGILPLFHSKLPSSRFIFLGRTSKDKRILFTFLFLFSFICFSWLFIIPDSESEQQLSYTQIYANFAPHISNRVDPIQNRLPISQPPVLQDTSPLDSSKSGATKVTVYDLLTPGREGMFIIIRHI
ncbi:hypothetical protein LOD99_9173 [Oopsacas minuta]|uniref:Uncharacterized protein n=1 Tax=Oopsacas minuta TaxID=111878 RepID=A0AAV7JDF3_9METZ|nr:hypothetical protein LOD99_9173 [Oopsacas minuta]